mmetsp:Transcript_11450/g.36367  ORF Transcript_11450/g.36367 Transcript_11450/m.36367 type:complete len:2088 (+) Transcript_11450:35-6298(+)
MDRSATSVLPSATAPRWDDDFVFPDLKKQSVISIATVGQSTSGTVEDWDLELSGAGDGTRPKVHGDHDNAPVVGFEHSSAESDDTSIDVAEADGLLNSCVFTYSNGDEKKRKGHTESLLEHLDRHHVDARGESTFSPEQPLPRPPTLFSACRRMHMSRPSLLTPREDDGIASSELSQELVQTAFLDQRRPERFPTSSVPTKCRRVPHECGSSPHAPETAHGVLAWLHNLCAKVQTTRAVVARPSPKITAARECERLPSEELALERRLRVVEMAFCSAETTAQFDRALSQLQGLLRLLDDRWPVRRAHRCTPLVHLDSDPCFSGIDCIERTVQCASRLVRLVCRMAQHCDENNYEPSMHRGVRTSDIASLRRCGQAFMHDVRDNNVSRLRIELTVDEGVAHLALIHLRRARAQGCWAGGSCWCSALPPLPRAAFMRTVVSIDKLHSRECSLEELEATALSDILLDSMGYSPLTSEQLLHGENNCTPPIAMSNDVDLHFSPRHTKASESEHSSFAFFSDHQIEARLAKFVRMLPATSMGKAKAALALGLCHLRGSEQPPCLAMDALVTGMGTSTPLGLAAGGARHALSKTTQSPQQHLLAFATTSTRWPQFQPGIAQQKHHFKFSHHAAQAELRTAEMLLFEAVCVIEQHSSMQPVDLPFYACQYGAGLISVTSGADFYPATSYSLLVGSMGLSALSALARVLDRRSKHAYAVLALEVCVAILKLRNDRNASRRLQRELATVSARQGNWECQRYCINLLKDLDEKFTLRAHQCRRENLSYTELRSVPCARRRHAQNLGAAWFEVGAEYHSLLEIDSADRLIQLQFNSVNLGARRISNSQFWKESLALSDIHEIVLATELAVSRVRSLDKEENARLMLAELCRRLDERRKLTSPGSTASSELGQLFDRRSLGLAKAAIDSSRPSEALVALDACLASGRKVARFRRVCLLSWSAKACLELGETRRCEEALARISRLRERSHGHGHNFLVQQHPPRKLHYSRSGHYARDQQVGWGLSPLVACDEFTSCLTMALPSCLLCFCGPKHDVGELYACCDLVKENPCGALRRLAPTVAAVESVVSTLGTQEGLAELGRLYRLRGAAHEAITKDAPPKTEFPFRIDRPVGDRECLDRGLSELGLHSVSTMDSSAQNMLLIRSLLAGDERNDVNVLQRISDHFCRSKFLAAMIRVCAVATACMDTCRRFIGHNVAVHLAENGSSDARQSYPSNRHQDRSSNARRGLERPCTTSSQSLTCSRRRRAFRSRHYRVYRDSDELSLEASRWYRRSLECFKALDDGVGVAISASAFAHLQLERVFSHVVFERVSLVSVAGIALVYGQAQRTKPGKPNVCEAGLLDDVDAAARCALSLAASACEPIILLETHLNVAEVSLLRRDRLAAIAHWWEARELFLRLFVSGTTVVLVQNKRINRNTVEKLRAFLERLIRFLAACDRAMIAENRILLDIFVCFERDANSFTNTPPRRYPFMLPSQGVAAAGSGSHRSPIGTCSSECYSSRCPFRRCHDKPTRCQRLSTDESVLRDSISGCFARIRQDVEVHRKHSLNSRLTDLRDRNRSTLRLLTSRMRLHNTMINEPSTALLRQARPFGSDGELVGECHKTTVYALHVMTTLFMYCPASGARYTVPFGRGATQLSHSATSLFHLGDSRAVTEGRRSSSTWLCKHPCSPDKDTHSTHNEVKRELCCHAAIYVALLNGIKRAPAFLSAGSDGVYETAGPKGLMRKLNSFRSLNVCSLDDTGVEARKQALVALSRDLALSPLLFEGLLNGLPSSGTHALRCARPLEHQSVHSVRLVCSERTQLLPWECLVEENVRVSRAYYLPIARAGMLSVEYCVLHKYYLLGSHMIYFSKVPLTRSVGMQLCARTCARTRGSSTAAHARFSRFMSLKKPARHPTFTRGDMSVDEQLLDPNARCWALHDTLRLLTYLCCCKTRAVASSAIIEHARLRDTAKAQWSFRIAEFKTIACGMSCTSLLHCGAGAFKLCARNETGASTSNVDLLLLDMASLHSTTEVVHELLGSAKSHVLCVPAQCFNIVQAEAIKLLGGATRIRNLPRCYTEVLFADFARKMSHAVAAPVIHLVTP